MSAPAPALAPDDVYRLYFHGPAYRVVGAAWRDADGAAARFAADLPAQFGGGGPAATSTGTRLVELCFQAAGLWEAGIEGRLALPLHVDALRLAAVPAESPELTATARPDGRGGFDCAVRDGTGAVVLRVEGYRTVPLPDPPPADVLAPVRHAMGT
jgi:hypothetical protein